MYSTLQIDYSMNFGIEHGEWEFSHSHGVGTFYLSYKKQVEE